MLASALVENSWVTIHPSSWWSGLLIPPKRGCYPVFCGHSVPQDFTPHPLRATAPRLPYQNPGNAFRVIEGSFVTTEDGTGVVHTAPPFGADDARVAKEAKNRGATYAGLRRKKGNRFHLLTSKQCFRPEMGDLAGKYVKNEYYNASDAPERSGGCRDCHPPKKENRAFKVEKYVHNYSLTAGVPDKPVLYYPMDSWFIRASAAKERMAEQRFYQWKPASTGEGRFGKGLKTPGLEPSFPATGHTLPIWRNADVTEEIGTTA